MTRHTRPTCHTKREYVAPPQRNRVPVKVKHQTRRERIEAILAGISDDAGKRPPVWLAIDWEEQQNRGTGEMDRKVGKTEQADPGRVLHPRTARIGRRCGSRSLDRGIGGDIHHDFGVRPWPWFAIVSPGSRGAIPTLRSLL